MVFVDLVEVTEPQNTDPRPRPPAPVPPSAAQIGFDAMFSLFAQKMFSDLEDFL